MMGHSTMMFIFSVLVSLVFTFIAKHDSRERVRYFLYLLGSFVLFSVAASWLMYPLPL